MSAIRKTLIASALVLSFAAPALAETDNWTMHENMFYAVDTHGKTIAFSRTDKAMAMMSKAHRVPRGTVFFMKGNDLYMMSMNGPNFDRALGAQGN